jgi:DHA2 family multidrug resistance protein
LQHMFQSKGMAADEALKSGYKLLDYSILKQASVLSYMDAFLWLGVMFLLCIPFVLLVKAKKQAGKVDLSEAMH